MIKKTMCITLLLFLLVVSFTFANNLEQWKFTKDIENVELGYNEILLDEEVYKNSKENLSDIRIINSSNDIIPYYIENYKTNKTSTLMEYETKKILQFQEKSTNFIDFEVINGSENTDIVTSRLIFNFRKKQSFLYDINLYGSYDNLNWEYISSNKIYSTKDGTKKYLDFKKPLKFKYYRVAFLNKYEDVKVEKLSAININEEETNISYKKTKEVPFSVETEDNISKIKINNENLLKINKIKINSDDMFDRYYTLQINMDETTEYKNLQSGRIYNIDLEGFSPVNKIIQLNTFTQGKDLVIKVHNKDNLPIKIDSIEITYYVDKLIFKVENDEIYSMFFGNEFAKKPKYDIEKFKEYIKSEKKQLAIVGPLKINNSFEEEEEVIKEKYDYKAILNLLVVIIAIVLIFIIFNTYRNEK